MGQLFSSIEASSLVFCSTFGKFSSPRLPLARLCKGAEDQVRDPEREDKSQHVEGLEGHVWQDRIPLPGTRLPGGDGRHYTLHWD